MAWPISRALFRRCARPGFDIRQRPYLYRRHRGSLWSLSRVSVPQAPGSPPVRAPFCVNVYIPVFAYPRVCLSPSSPHIHRPSGFPSSTSIATLDRPSCILNFHRWGKLMCPARVEFRRLPGFLPSEIPNPGAARVWVSMVGIRTRAGHEFCSGCARVETRTRAAFRADRGGNL